MPVPHHAPLVVAPTLHAAIVFLRARGIRLSRPRIRLLESLYASAAPRTAEQIAADGAGDVATVYRNLGALEEAGIVRHSHAAGGPARWAPATAMPEVAECEWCGRREPLAPAAAAQLRALTRRLLGFEAHFEHAPLPGLCGRCADRARLSGGAVR